MIAESSELRAFELGE